MGGSSVLVSNAQVQLQIGILICLVLSNYGPNVSALPYFKTICVTVTHMQCIKLARIRITRR